MGLQIDYLDDHRTDPAEKKAAANLGRREPQGGVQRLSRLHAHEPAGRAD
jgi:hypothetical protein